MKSQDITEEILAINKSGWAVEFRAKGELVECTFRRYGEVDVNSLAATGRSLADAFESAKTSCIDFISVELGKSKGKRA